MNDLLDSDAFPLFTRGRLGLPPTVDAEDTITAAMQQAQWIIRDAIGQAAIDELVDDDPSNDDRRLRFTSAYQDLTSSILWGQVTTSTGIRAGSERQGQRQSTVEAGAATAAAAAKDAAFWRYVATMLALGYDVSPGMQHGMYAIPLERV